MKATDLMIGDWIMFKWTQHQFKVYSINHDKISNTEGAVSFEINDAVIPIPLTKEILKKNGFDGEVYLWINAGDEKTLEYYPFEHRLSLWYGEGKSQELLFKYQCFSVHELQHALKLCGIEKDITL